MMYYVSKDQQSYIIMFSIDEIRYSIPFINIYEIIWEKSIIIILGQAHMKFKIYIIRLRLAPSPSHEKLPRVPEKHAKMRYMYTSLNQRSLKESLKG